LSHRAFLALIWLKGIGRDQYIPIMMNRYTVIRLLVIWSLLGTGMVSCKMKNKGAPIIYDGPLTEAQNVDLLYTEKDMIKLKMKAKKVNSLQNGDEEFPEGIYLEFFNEQGKMTSTLRANQAYHFKMEDKWRGRGKVEVKNLEKKQQLNTEELFWIPSKKKIFTDKFVTIKLETEVLYGTGLDAVEDLSSYTITKPEGEFDVKE
jgi:LPS export ABC transporter protein LptC